MSSKIAAGTHMAICYSSIKIRYWTWFELSLRKAKPRIRMWIIRCLKGMSQRWIRRRSRNRMLRSTFQRKSNRSQLQFLNYQREVYRPLTYNVPTRNPCRQHHSKHRCPTCSKKEKGLPTFNCPNPKSRQCTIVWALFRILSSIFFRVCRNSIALWRRVKVSGQTMIDPKSTKKTKRVQMKSSSNRNQKYWPSQKPRRQFDFVMSRWKTKMSIWRTNTPKPLDSAFQRKRAPKDREERHQKWMRVSQRLLMPNKSDQSHQTILRLLLIRLMCRIRVLPFQNGTIFTKRSRIPSPRRWRATSTSSMVPAKKTGWERREGEATDGATAEVAARAQAAMAKRGSTRLAIWRTRYSEKLS